ncbi:MAG: hypothetical protein IT341_06970 [Chloroflexi bacterium]|nr:hypothetical protein [Chloroflexota bacterium]
MTFEAYDASQPIRELHRLPFWPALVLVANAEDAAAMLALVAYVQRWRPSLEAPQVEVCRVAGVCRAGRPRAFRTVGEVPGGWLGSSALATLAVGEVER